MNAPLHLNVTDYESEERWRWVLSDARGTFLADHEVNLAGDGSSEARAFRDLPASALICFIHQPGSEARTDPA